MYNLDNIIHIASSKQKCQYQAFIFVVNDFSCSVYSYKGMRNKAIVRKEFGNKQNDNLYIIMCKSLQIL